MVTDATARRVRIFRPGQVMADTVPIAQAHPELCDRHAVECLVDADRKELRGPE